MKKHYWDLFRLWVRNYFKHPLPNIRQASPIVPGRLYNNFGNVCKAVRYSNEEEQVLYEAEMEAAKARSMYGTTTDLDPNALIEMVRSVGGDKQMVEGIQAALNDQLPPKCLLCDFNKRGIPCPLYNCLNSGETVCDQYRYIIIKPVQHV